MSTEGSSQGQENNRGGPMPGGPQGPLPGAPTPTGNMSGGPMHGVGHETADKRCSGVLMQMGFAPNK